jgi:hypothetical protein
MIEYFGLENIIYCLVAGLLILGYLHDKFSKHAVEHIDKLQDRVYELEKQLGIREELD